MRDIDEAMEETREKARSKFGVGGGPDESGGVDGREETPPDEAPASGPDRDDPSETQGALETQGTQATDDAGGTDRGRLVDEYENVNIYIPAELKEELNVLFKQMDLEHSRGTDGGLEKHWDFYPAVVRTVLRNEADLREELGLE